jgi:CMP-N,N'-diacetyllegionaminic acid synthase
VAGFFGYKGICRMNPAISCCAIIPARGGSTGIVRKNLMEINAVPLVGRSILHAKSSPSVGRIIVSTDDEEIRQVALKYGAEVPFVRPAALAGNHVLDLPVFQHALDFLRDSEGFVPDLVLHLRPTAPHRLSRWIDEAIQLLIDHPDADSVRSVSEPEKHPYRMFRLDADGYLDPIMKHEHPVPYLPPRQVLPKVYYYNCVIDVTKPATIYGKGSMTGDKMLPYIMNPSEVIDIDTKRDLEIARLLIKD